MTKFKMFGHRRGWKKRLQVGRVTPCAPEALNPYERWMVKSNLATISNGEQATAIIATLRANGYRTVADAVERIHPTIESVKLEQVAEFMANGYSERYQAQGRAIRVAEAFKQPKQTNPQQIDLWSQL